MGAWNYYGETNSTCSECSTGVLNFSLMVTAALYLLGVTTALAAELDFVHRVQQRSFLLLHHQLYCIIQFEQKSTTSCSCQPRIHRNFDLLVVPYHQLLKQMLKLYGKGIPIGFLFYVADTK